MWTRRAAWRSLFGILWLTLLLGSASQAARALTVAELMSAPDRFEKKEVVLNGIAERVWKRRVSQHGNWYTTFWLTDLGARVNVFSQGRLPVKDKDRVEVHGVFYRVRRLDLYTFHDEVEASSVRRLP